MHQCDFQKVSEYLWHEEQVRYRENIKIIKTIEILKDILLE